MNKNFKFDEEDGRKVCNRKLKAFTMIIFSVTILFYLFSLSFISAGIYDDCEIYGNCQPASTGTTNINYSTVNLNNSQYLQGYVPSDFASSIWGYNQTTAGNNLYALLDGSNQPFTGDVNMSKANPVITLKDTQSKTGWATNETLGGIDFYTSDTSGSGVGVVGSIRSIAYGGTSAPFVGLGIYNTGTTRGVNTSTSTPSIFVDYYNNVHIGAIDLQTARLNVNGAINCTTLNTGLGANELYAMNQNVRTSDAVNFGAVTSSTASTITFIGQNSQNYLASTGAFMILRANNGSAMMPNNRLGGLDFYGYNGTSNQIGARISATTTGGWGGDYGNTQPTMMQFFTVSSRSSLLEKGRISSNGTLGWGTTTTTDDRASIDVKGRQINDGTAISLRNGDNSARGFNYTQIRLGYNGSNNYFQYLTTEHSGTTDANKIKLWTSDGTSLGKFPNNAIIGLTINNRKICVNCENPVYNLDVNGSTNLNGQVNITGNINQISGNVSINNYYGEMWNKSDTGFEKVDLVSTDTYVKVQNLSAGTNNGFTNGNGNLTAQFSGMYSVNAKVGATATAIAGEYGMKIFVNEVGQYNCYDHEEPSTAPIGFIIICLVRLNAGDVVSVRFDDHADPVRDLILYNGNVNLFRIGN